MNILLRIRKLNLGNLSLTGYNLTSSGLRLPANYSITLIIIILVLSKKWSFWKRKKNSPLSVQLYGSISKGIEKTLQV